MKNGNKQFKRNALASSLAVVLTLSFAGTVSAQDAQAQQDQESKPAAEQKKLDTVKVVGSRIKRSEVEGPSPVTVITAEQIELEGFNTVFDALETLSQNNGFGQGDFNTNGFTPNASVINLRGMGPGRTLLLVNGRRANDYPFPYNGRSNFQNFNNIPAAAVARIEVLAGGASAIYGSDAVAGVINVVLKDNYDGQSLQFKAQTSDQGGREIFDAQFVGGASDDNWSLVYALQAYNSNALHGYERDFMDSAEDNKSFPGVNGQTGVGGYQPPIGIQIRRFVPTGGSSTNSYLSGAGANCNADSLYRPWTYTSSVSGATLGAGCGYDRFPAEPTVVNGNKDFSGYVFGNFQFDNGMEGWASLSAYQSDSKLSSGVEQWFGYRANSYHYDPQFGARILPIRALTPSTYGGSEGTYNKYDENSYEVAVGLRGNFADKFDWDMYASTAQYKADHTFPRLDAAKVNAFFLGPQLGVAGSGAYVGVNAPNGTPVYALNFANFYGQITPEQYDAMSAIVKIQGESKNSAIGFSMTGDLMQLPAGPLGFAAVLEASEQSYDLVADPRILPGNANPIYNRTGTGGGGDRSRYAAGFEFSVPILESLKLSVAGRYDKYDDITAVDEAKTWNAGLEWRPFDNLLVRASKSTSFKAPDMHYVFSERSGAFSGLVDYTRCASETPPISVSACSGAGANYNYSAFITSQGNPGLNEETGESWSTGFVWDIMQDLSLTVDYYEIMLNNEVQVQSGGTILGDEYGCLTGTYTNGQPFPYASDSSYCANIDSLIDRDADGRITEIRSGPINIAFREVRGADANMRYRWETDSYGSFSASVAWSHTFSQRSQARAGVPIVSYRDQNVNSDYRSRVRATVSWSKDDWDSTLFMNRIGSFPLWNLNNTQYSIDGISARTQPYFTYNMSVGYRFNEDFSMRFSMNNIFNNNGNFDKTYNSYPYTWYGYDLIGRTYGLQVNYNF